MNVPRVYLTGEPMGGWVQYSMSPTVGAWLSQHFYLQWKYSADRVFLKERAYPFLKDVVTYLEQISVVDADGVRRLPLSSSPEIFDNSIDAWFKDMTNYDLSLMHFAFNAASELASELELTDEAGHWKAVGAQLPDLNLDEDGFWPLRKGFPYDESHRHFPSHVYPPLGLIDWSQERIPGDNKSDFKEVQDFGTDYWWAIPIAGSGNMKARAFDGERAADALRTLPNALAPIRSMER